MTTKAEEQTVTPYLIVSGAEELLKFLTEVFNAEEIMKVPAATGGIMHAEVRIGNSRVMLADSTEKYPPMPAGLYILVDDTDATYQRALAAGAVSVLEPYKPEYAERAAGVRDRCGNTWWLTTAS